MYSRLYTGEVRHRRLAPVEHQLSYSLFMPCIDLDEIEQLQSKVFGFGQRWWHWARFKRDDYLGQGPLKIAVQDKVFELTGVRLSGRVEAVVHLRYLGLFFSPVNFYYLYDDTGDWRFMLAEVSNTPWNERHYYALPADEGEEGTNWQHPKAFHVSPFNPINQQYIWKLKPLGKRLSIHLECHTAECISADSSNSDSSAARNKVFDATMAMRQQALTSSSLLRVLLKTPSQTVKVVLGIYWQALKLYVKRAPLYSHPKKNVRPDNKESCQ
ncbi:DUF1365 domain-containing protein [Vibrio sp. WXL210]|uniref:DUF1365 domain-containing protein n=1 Tax=Vibrio sp. WXL210 TaxID=3450709 RepID=UPI003EC4D434